MLNEILNLNHKASNMSKSWFPCQLTQNNKTGLLMQGLNYLQLDINKELLVRVITRALATFITPLYPRVKVTMAVLKDKH